MGGQRCLLCRVEQGPVGRSRWGMVGSGLQRCLGTLQLPLSQHMLIVDSLEPGPAQGKRQERKERMEWVPPKQLLLCPSTLSNFQLGFQLTGDMRLGVGQALTRRFPDTWRASDYPVITPFIASLQVVTFWQAFPWKGPFPAPGSQHLQGNRQAHWTLLLQPCSIALPS